MTPCWIHLSELRKDSDPLDYLKKYEAEISEAIEKEKEDWRFRELCGWAEGEMKANDNAVLDKYRMSHKERNDAMLDFSSAVARMGEAGVSREVAELFFRRKWKNWRRND